MGEDFFVTCPFCGEEIEIHLESDVTGTLIQDCEVCCNPIEISYEVEEGRVVAFEARAD